MSQMGMFNSCFLTDDEDRSKIPSECRNFHQCHQLHFIWVINHTWSTSSHVDLVITPKALLLKRMSCFFDRFLGKLTTREAFLGLSFSIRIIQGLGEAGYITASFSLVADGFPNSVETTFVSELR